MLWLFNLVVLYRGREFNNRSVQFFIKEDLRKTLNGRRQRVDLFEHESNKMPRSPSWSILKEIINSKFIILICVFTCTYVVWTQYALPPYELPTYVEDNDDLTAQAIENVGRDSRFAEVYRKKTHLPSDMKYMLLWTRVDFAPFYNFGIGQKALISKNCSVINCYFTSDRNFFGGDLTKFHAIAFNGRNLLSSDLPKTRAPHQKYLYVNTESAAYYPHCEKVFDGFFNWTFTVRLDSDIPNPYFIIRDPTGEIIGPKVNTKWKKTLYDNDNNIDSFDKSFTSTLMNKTKAAAWFVSHCSSQSKREVFVEKLREALKVYNLDIDVYGSCGQLKCPKDNQSECHRMLERDYFFYMSLENSFARDYVTEKVLTAVQHKVIPIVWGGADYSRFLPPNSYIDGRKMTPKKLAFQMAELIRLKGKYKKFFTWMKHYSYHYLEDDICSICARLNDKATFEKYSTYPFFREWWNEKKC